MTWVPLMNAGCSRYLAVPSRSQVASHSAWSSGRPGAVLGQRCSPGAARAPGSPRRSPRPGRGSRAARPSRGLRRSGSGAARRTATRDGLGRGGSPSRPLSGARRSRGAPSVGVGVGRGGRGRRLRWGLAEGTPRRPAGVRVDRPAATSMASTARNASCAVRPTRSTSRSCGTVPGTETTIAAFVARALDGHLGLGHAETVDALADDRHGLVELLVGDRRPRCRAPPWAAGSPGCRPAGPGRAAGCASGPARTSRRAARRVTSQEGHEDPPGAVARRSASHGARSCGRPRRLRRAGSGGTRRRVQPGCGRSAASDAPVRGIRSPPGRARSSGRSRSSRGPFGTNGPILDARRLRRRSAARPRRLARSATACDHLDRRRRDPGVRSPSARRACRRSGVHDPLTGCDRELPRLRRATRAGDRRRRLPRWQRRQQVAASWGTSKPMRRAGRPAAASTPACAPQAIGPAGGGDMPRCRQAASVATRPRGVR